MTLQSLINNVPFEDKVTISIWSADWDEELERETAVTECGHLGSLKTIAEAYNNRVKVVRVFSVYDGGITIECKLKK